MLELWAAGALLALVLSNSFFAELFSGFDWVIAAGLGLQLSNAARRRGSPAGLCNFFGSGLRKIVSETEKLPGYTEVYKPEFSSTATDFRVILKNVNYHHDHSIMRTTHDKTHDATHDTTQDATHDRILAFCIEPHSKSEIAEHCGHKNTKNFTQKYLRPLLNDGTLKMTLPDKPKSKHQKYITVRTE